MAEYRSLYHTPEGERGIGKVIVGWTWVLALFYSWKALKYNFSHEEWWEPNSQGRFVEVLPSGRVIYLGKVYSSTTRGDWKGVRWALANEVIGKHPCRWKYVSVQANVIRYIIFRPEMTRKVGNLYDFVMIITGFATPIAIDPKDKDYCSGLCCWVKYRLGILKKWHKRISPRRSAMLLSQDWGEPVGL